MHKYELLNNKKCDRRGLSWVTI